MTARRPSVSTAVLSAVLLGALLLTGCSSGSDEAGSSGESAQVAAGDSVAAPQAATGGGTTGEAPLTDVDLRAAPGAAVIRTGELAVEVEDVAGAAREAVRVVTAAGGRVDAEDRSGTESASLQLRVPPAEYDRVVDALAGLGEESSRRLGVEDVTDQVVDLDARVASQQASVERVRALLARAESLGEVVQVEGELTRRTADLEALQARLAALEAQVDLGTLTLSLFGEGESSVPGAALTPADGLRGGWDALLATGRLVGVALGAVLPFVPLAVGGVLLARWLRRRPGVAAG